MRYPNYKWKKGQVRKTALVLILAMGLTAVQPVLASTIGEANSKKSEAQSGLEEAQSTIGNIENKQSKLQGEIDALDAELVDVIMNLNILEGDLDTKGEELEKVQAELAQAQKDEETQYEAMKKRIRFMYERGDTAFLTSILESESITDLLNRVEYFNEVYDYDRDLLVTYQTTKLQVADLKIQVEGEIAEMEEMQANYQEEQNRYETLIAEKQGQMSDFDSKLAEAQQLAADYQSTIEQQNEIIRQEEARAEEQRQEEARRQEAAAAAASNNSNNNSTGGSSSSTSGTNSGSGTSTGGSSNSGSGSSSGSGGNLNPGFVTGVSGGNIVNYASSFIGNPYVWGGTDPNTGADCSGFVQYVYRQYGISLPRTSGEQRYAGTEVSYSNAQPGDLICYSGHVAIYTGNGQIVHASSSAPYPVGGIKTGTATYRTIISVRRVL